MFDGSIRPTIPNKTLVARLEDPTNRSYLDVMEGCVPVTHAHALTAENPAEAAVHAAERCASLRAAHRAARVGKVHVASRVEAMELVAELVSQCSPSVHSFLFCC
jgi:hypothetical protein